MYLYLNQFIFRHKGFHYTPCYQVSYGANAEDDEIYINDFPHRISEPPLLDNKGDTAFIIMTPAEGWRLHAAGTVVNKDSIALNVKMTHTFLLEEDWFSIKKEQEGSIC